MKSIKKGSKGKQVERWQRFLVTEGFRIKPDGDFGNNTHNATVEFQEKNGLSADGVVGNNSYLKAFHLGYEGEEQYLYPDKPTFDPLNSIAKKEKVFGRFNFKSISKDSDDVVILGDWTKKNITRVEIPQLTGVDGVYSTNIPFHRLGAKQLQRLFADWEEAGQMHLVKSWAGSFVPRFIRGRKHNRNNLSQHAFGSAFDINVPWNGLNRVPAVVGKEGSVRELVAIAHKNGFYWGGHFSRLDGMHFEVAKIIK